MPEQLNACLPTAPVPTCAAVSGCLGSTWALIPALNSSWPAGKNPNWGIFSIINFDEQNSHRTLLPARSLILPTLSSRNAKILCSTLLLCPRTCFLGSIWPLWSTICLRALLTHHEYSRAPVTINMCLNRSVRRQLGKLWTPGPIPPPGPG